MCIRDRYGYEDGSVGLKYKESAVEIYPVLSDGEDGRWRGTKETFSERVDRLYYKKKSRGGFNVYEKIYLTDDDRKSMGTILINSDYSTEKGSLILKELFDNNFFSFPKSSILIKKIITNSTESDSIILDFFSGSATTAHAVMQLNAEDGGNRKFIMVQLPEATDDPEFANICEIGKERIRRAGEKIKEEKGLEAQDLDIGFKVLKLDTSNIRKWQPDYDDLEQSLLDYLDNYVEGRTELDVVYEIMLKYGLDLTYPVDELSLIHI